MIILIKIDDISNLQFAYHNDEGKILKIIDSIDTLLLTDRNVGTRI